ncbi:MAG: extracellular solute-binding protein [Caldilineaceae bacterium SB0668_bin_21]|nr:extracellular solute-binding protein [Caldilineaceae bacterium SB0668_bin_21]MYC21964.1 extracellular solute-binding protein [Caldilineaceae bacterium SB0662_bin_25]
MNQNQMTRRQMLQLSAGLGAASLLAACVAAPAAPAEDGGGEAAPDMAMSELSLWSMSYPPHDNAWNMLADQYNEANDERNVTVEPKTDPWTTYASGLSAGTAGDLLSIHGAAAASFMATNTLLPLTETLGGMGTIKDRFFSAVMDYYTYQGDVYGIPLHNNTPGIGFITNLDLWQEAGMDPPLTYTHWDDVWQDAKSLTQTDDDGIINVAGLSMRNYHNIQYLCGAIYEQGATYLDEETGVWSVNTPEGIRALTELFHDPIFTHEVDSPDLPAVFNGLAEGRMAMGGIWIDYIPFAATAFPEGNFGFTMRPGIDGADPVVVGEGGWGLNVNAASENPEDALDFIEYLNDDGVMIQWLQSQHSLPCVFSLLDHEWYSSDEAKFLQPALATVQDWVWIGPVGTKYAMDDVFWPALEELSLGAIGVEDLAARLDEDLTDRVQRFREDTGYEW